MTDVFNELGWARGMGMLARLRAVLTNATKAASPPLLFGLRLWASFLGRHLGGARRAGGLDGRPRPLAPDL